MESPTGETLSWLSPHPQRTSTSTELSQAGSTAQTPVATRGTFAAGTRTSRTRSCSRSRPASGSQQRNRADTTSSSSDYADAKRPNKGSQVTRTTSTSRSPTPMRAQTPACRQPANPQQYSMCTPPETEIGGHNPSQPRGSTNGDSVYALPRQRRATTTRGGGAWVPRIPSVGQRAITM